MMTKKSLIQSPEAIEKMRVAGKLASDVLVMLDEHVRVGISTEALNQIAQDYIVNVQQALPAPCRRPLRRECPPPWSWRTARRR